MQANIMLKNGRTVLIIVSPIADDYVLCEFQNITDQTEQAKLAG